MQQLGEYLVHRLIGEGSMGKVFEAEERLSRRRVALKVLREDLARSEDGRRRFLREMTILSHLDHPNVVRCLACTEAGGHLVMVLEHIAGHTLREVLRARTRLPWQEAVRIGADIASGLGAAHGHNPPIVHRDLKPENVMISTQGQTKVMDFGVAKVLDAMAPQTLHTVGTLQYMSPEQIQGYAVDPRADLYCLGLLLYEMMAGQAPFVSVSPRELLHLHSTQAPPRLPPDVSASLPPGLEALVFELLAKRPDQRPAHADAVRQRLEAALHAPNATSMPTAEPTHGVPPSAHGAPVSHPGSMGTLMLIERAGLAHERGRRLRWVWAIVAGVILLVVASAYHAWNRSDPAAPEASTAVIDDPQTPVAEHQPPDQPDADDPNAKRLDEVRQRAQRERDAANERRLSPPRAAGSDDGDTAREPDDDTGSRGEEESDEEPDEGGFFGRLRTR